MGSEERTTAAAPADLVAGFAERFRHGSALLLLAFRALRQDSIAWRRYVRTCTVQAVVTVAVASVFVSTARTSSEGLREVRVRKAMEHVSTTAPHPPPPPPHPKATSNTKHAVAPSAAPGGAAASEKPTAPATPAGDTKDEDKDADEDDAEADAAAAEEASAEKAQADFEKRLAKLQASVVKLSKKAGPTAVRRDQDFQESRVELDEQLADLERAAEKVQPSEEDKAALVRLGGELDVLEQKTKPGWWDSALALVLSIYGALSVVQAAVIALSRDYHAAIARDASLLLGVSPEDPPLEPRVRLNVAWIRRKFKQRTRSLLVFLPGVALITLVAAALPGRAIVTSVLTSLWAAYWWVVWTASKSARAWEREGVARPPWFLRLWHTYLAPLPFVGWMTKAWEGLWGRLTRSAYSPAEAVEGQPAEFAGLAAARALQLIPVLKIFVRPLVPVAAARLLAERQPAAVRLLQTPQERATVMAQRAAMPVSRGALEARDEM
jgi:hypothetical protein